MKHFANRLFIKLTIIYLLIMICGSCNHEQKNAISITEQSLEAFYDQDLETLKSKLDTPYSECLRFMPDGYLLLSGFKYKFSVLRVRMLSDSNESYVTVMITEPGNKIDSLTFQITEMKGITKLVLTESNVLKLLDGETKTCFEIAKHYYDSGRFDNAYNWFQPSVLAGNAEALYYSGLIMTYRHKLSDAIDMLRKANEGGYLDAASELADLYKVSGQRNKAIATAKEAAEKGNTSAMVWLGTEYDTYFRKFGYTSPSDAQDLDSFYWYRRAALKGNVDGMWYLANIYEIGKFKPIDFDSAYYWYRKSALLEDGLSMVKLGRMTIEGKGTKKDFQLGWSWLEKGSKFNKSEAFYDMGEIYEKGIGVKVDKLRAIEYYQVSAKSGNALAEYKLSLLKSELGQSI